MLSAVAEYLSENCPECKFGLGNSTIIFYNGVPFINFHISARTITYFYGGMLGTDLRSKAYTEQTVLQVIDEIIQDFKSYTLSK